MCYFYEQKNHEENLMIVTEGEWQNGRSEEGALWKPKEKNFKEGSRVFKLIYWIIKTTKRF